MNFFITMQSVVIALLFMVPGFLLTKAKLAKPEHSKTLSAILIYVSGPAMVINAFQTTKYTKQASLNMLYFFIVTLILQILAILIFYLIFKKKFDEPKYRIIAIANAFGNVGFFGMPLIKSILPEHPIALCYSSMFMLSMNILLFTIGIFCITGEKKYISLKSAFINPTMIAMVVAIPLYLLSIEFHPILNTVCVSLANMTMPLCMIILGIRLASISFKGLFVRPSIYAICLIKLVIFPLFCYCAVYFLPLDDVFKASMLILASAPCAAVILTMAEMHDKEQEIAANALVITTILSAITIPLILLIL